MSSPKLTCPRCYTEYDLNLHMPRLIPNCGHTFCSQCITNLIDQSPTFFCPLDRIVSILVDKNLSSFPINFALKDIVAENADYESCQDHGERMKSVCMVDKCKVCNSCGLYGNHRGHEIRPFKKLEAQIDKEIISLENKLEEVKGWYKKFLESVRGKEETLLTSIKKKFQALRAALEEKENRVSKEVRNFFAKEEKEIRTLIGEDSNVRKEIKERILNLKDFAKEKDFIKMIEAANTQGVSNVDNQFFQRQLEALKKRIKEVEDKVGQPVTISDKTTILPLKEIGISLKKSKPTVANKENELRIPLKNIKIDIFVCPIPAHGHLVFTAAEARNYSSLGFVCDLCSGECLGSSWHCRICSYDICCACSVKENRQLN